MQELSTVRRDTPDGQRRQVTVLFADIVGYTPIAERIGEEATFELIQEITARMAEAPMTLGVPCAAPVFASSTR